MAIYHVALCPNSHCQGLVVPADANEKKVGIRILVKNGVPDVSSYNVHCNGCGKTMSTTTWKRLWAANPCDKIANL